MDGSLRVTKKTKLGDLRSPGHEALHHEKGLGGLMQEEAAFNSFCLSHKPPSISSGRIRE